MAALLGYLLTTAVAAVAYRPRRSSVQPRARLEILIPAHNEQSLVDRCIASLLTQSYPRELYSVTVIADNCTDGTAEVARRAGTDSVLERVEPDSRGKGRALRWAMDQILERDTAPDAIVVVDADSVADSEFLAELVAEFEAGADVVQADYVLASSGGSGSDLRVGAFILVNRVRQAGRSVLGQTIFLTGNGMLFSADVLRARPWGAFTSAEDLEYTLDLALNATRVGFAGGSHITAETAPNAAAAAVQQRRWEGGRMHLMRSRAPQLLKAAIGQRRPALAVTVVELAMPPLGLLAAVVAAGAGVSTVSGLAGSDRRGSHGWRVALVTLPAYVIIGLATGRAPRSTWQALRGVPGFVLRKPLSLLGVLRFRPDSWERTQRASEMTGDDERSHPS